MGIVYRCLCGDLQQCDLRPQAAAVQTQRRSVRAQRRQEDAAWQALRAERRQTQEVMRRHGLPEYATCLAQKAQWRALRHGRLPLLAQRAPDDRGWRQERRQRTNRGPWYAQQRASVRDA